MDYPGGAITNISVIDGFSTIYWRIYTEDSSIGTQSADSNPHNNGYNILRHLSRLKDLELKLRNQDCLISCYPRRLGLWIFSATPGFESLSPLVQDSASHDPSRLLIGSTSLKVSASGSIAALELIRSLSADSPAALGSAAGQARLQNVGPAVSRLGDTYSSSVTIYASFISAVAGAISVQLIRHHNAIPLGARTFFTGVDRNFYDSPTIENDDVDSYPALTTLRIELSQVGKVIISLQTVYQNGVSRLHVPTAGVADIRPNMDVWLAPNGTVARLINLNGDQSTVFTPTQAKNEVTSRQVMEARQRSWKDAVLEWIGTAGLPVVSAEEEHWVEIEVFEPLYARLAADYLRQSDYGQANSPLKRILWPSRYCFRRTKPTTMAPLEGMEGIMTETDDPLYFAEDWLNGAASRNDKHTSQNSTLSQGVQNKDVPTPKVEIPDNLESLARAAQYPDLQAASLVYPTPPDGALVPGIVHLSSDAFGMDVSDLGLSQTPAERSLTKQEELGSSKRQSGSDTGAGFASSNALGVGSGLYDANGDDDEDLFGAMNDKDFGSKGITDADFSFFDDQDFDAFGDENPKSGIEDRQQNPTTLVSFAPPALEETPIENSSEDQDVKATLAELGNKDEFEPKPDLNVDNKMETPLKVQDNKSDSQPLVLSRQTISPPLSPVEVKKILSTKTQQIGRTAPTEISQMDNHERRQSNYNPIPFELDMTVSDQKYGAAGRFFFSPKTDAAAVSASITPIPTVGFPRGRKHGTGLLADSDGIKAQRSAPTHSNRYRLRSESVSSDITSYSSSDDCSERGASPTRVTGVKRKRPLSEDDKSTTSSLERLSLASEADTTTLKEDNSVFLGNFFAVFVDWSLAGYFSLRQNQSSPVLVRKEELVQLAQLMVDQLTQSSLRHQFDGCRSLPDLEQDTISLHTFLQDTTIMGDIERLDLRGYISLQDSLVGTSETAASRQSVQRKDVKGSLFKLPPPQLRIHRGRDFLELLPPAISFWETFGFEPAGGPKNISAYCICPQMAKEGGDAFLNRLETLYSTCNFGQHVRGDKSKSFENGIGLWNISGGDAGYHPTMQSLRTICEGLGTALTQAPSVKDNFVVYVINPFTHAAAFADICSAFLQLFHKYIGDVDKTQVRHQLNELVLQVIPMDFVHSTTSIVVPTQAEFLNLALEVYNRCPPKDCNGGHIGCAPPVLLAESVPKVINFTLAPERVSPWQESKCLHLAISRSLDQRWITAAWSDSSGSCQLTMSYCIRARGSNVNRILSEVRQEIWETTKDIIERTQTRWKVFLARTEPVDQEEVDAWTGFLDQYNQATAMPVELAIFHVNIAPGLRLELPSTNIPVNAINPSSTPVSTPYGGMPSPDQFGGSVATPASGGGQGPTNAATPTEVSSLMEPESDAVLMDVYDESWAVILSHRLSNSPFMTEYRPSLLSGYLLRRNGVNDSQGVVSMGVNLVHTSRPCTVHEAVLREAFGSYRDLATLARTKGMFHVQRNTLPWHIATAVKGQELLSYIL